MRYSKLFGKTVKSIPRDLTATSHKLLYKGGFIRQMSAGRYSFLPLGIIVWKRIYDVIEKHLQAIESQLLLTPTLHPIEFWTATNRDKAFGPEMLVVDDHHGATFAIGATAEGMMVELVKKFNPSYRDLPIRIHQYSQKFRDEKRPRGGLLRVREFTMKDAYSFDVSEEKMMESYWAYHHAYERIFAELDLSAVPVEADSGAIGGDFNHEFIVPAEMGEGTAFKCTHCDYKAHEDRAEFKPKMINPDDELKDIEIIKQPEWVQTMDDNVKHYGLEKTRFLKNVVYKDENGRIIIAILRGDLDANPAKIKRVLNLDSLTEADETDLQKLGTKPGYVHSWGHKDAIFVGDLSLETVHNFIGGQKEETTDSINVNFKRDFDTQYFGDIAMAYEGALCRKCTKGNLHQFKGIEVGHVFKFDHFYSKPMGGMFVDQDGSQKPMWMGSYGIGLGRLMATIVETHYDEKGITWPNVVSPFHIHLISLNQEKQIFKRAQALYEKWTKQGKEVLWDDRENVTPGEKFADADLIGIPLRVIISGKTEAENVVEIKRRTEAKPFFISLDEIEKIKL